MLDVADQLKPNSSKMSKSSTETYRPNIVAKDLKMLTVRPMSLPMRENVTARNSSTDFSMLFASRDLSFL